jgi:hypothetical protein
MIYDNADVVKCEAVSYMGSEFDWHFIIVIVWGMNRFFNYINLCLTFTFE